MCSGGAAVAARLTPAQAVKLGLIEKPAKKRTTRTEAKGPYRTRCCTCREEFTSIAAEDRHLSGAHWRFEVVLDG